MLLELDIKFALCCARRRLVRLFPDLSILAINLDQLFMNDTGFFSIFGCKPKPFTVLLGTLVVNLGSISYVLVSGS